MSAHREPDVVADYCKNARMRGLRVIIAGAGLSAALPGTAAAHTDLPVIGVPLTSRMSALGGLDALLSHHADAARACRSAASAWTTRATPRTWPSASWARDADASCRSRRRSTRARTCGSARTRSSSPTARRGIYGVVEKPDFALVVPWDGERLHLVGQYRYPVASFEWEFPQGGVEGFVARAAVGDRRPRAGGGDGLRADRLQHLGRMWHAYGFSQQGFDAFLATGLTAGETRREHVRADDGVAHGRRRRARGDDPVRRAARRAVGRGMGPRRACGRLAVIDRYTRPEIGAVWTDEARMEAWRRVEVAACEEMDGPTAADLEAIRAATFTVEAVQEREEITDHDVAAFVDVLSARAPAPAGRWIHFGLTSLRRARHRARRCSCRPRATIVVAGARELVGALAERAREHVDTVCVGRTHGVHAEPTTFGIKLAGFAIEAHRNAQRLERAFAPGGGRRDLRRRRHLRGDRPATSRRACSRGSASRREPVSTQVVAARPARRAAPGDRARRRGPRAPRDRDPPPAAHRGARGRGAVPRRRPEGLERDAPQAQPDHHRAHHRPRARAARQRAGGRRERRPVARARHLALRRRARDPARLDDPARLHAAPRARGSCAGSSSHEDRMRAQPRPHARRAVLPAGAARARRVGHGARRGLPDRPGGRPARVGRAGIAAARPARATRCSASISTTVFDLAAYTRYAPEIVGRLDVIPPV